MLGPGWRTHIGPPAGVEMSDWRHVTKELMEIRKAVITAAGPGQRTLPLQTLVDRDGKTKTALEIIVGEALNSGAEEICVVIHPGDAEAYRAAAGAHGKGLRVRGAGSSRGATATPSGAPAPSPVRSRFCCWSEIICI